MADGSGDLGHLDLGHLGRPSLKGAPLEKMPSADYPDVGQGVLDELGYSDMGF
jgi:hypothetical protein